MVLKLHFASTSEMLAFVKEIGQRQKEAKSYEESEFFRKMVNKMEFEQNDEILMSNYMSKD